VCSGLRDLKRLAAARVKDSGAALHDARNFDEVRDQHVIEVGRDDGAGVGAAARAGGGQDAVVDRPGSAVPDLQRPGRPLVTAGPLAHLCQRVALGRGALGAFLLAAGQGVVGVIRLLGPALGVQDRLDPGVEGGHLLVVGVPLALLLRREGAVLVGRVLSDFLRVVPDVHTTVAEPLGDF
jgi:hypothetical protein